MKSQYGAHLFGGVVLIVFAFVLTGCAMGPEQDATVADEMGIDESPSGTDEAALDPAVHRGVGERDRSEETRGAASPASEESHERAQRASELGVLDETPASCGAGKEDFGSEPASNSCDNSAGEVDHGSPQPLDPQPAPNDDDNSEDDEE
jgi:hypothetical protein